MKSHVFTALLTFLGLGLALPGMAGIGDENIRFVNLDKVFNDYYRTSLADSQLKDQVQAMQEEQKKLIEVYEGMQDEFKEMREKSTNPAQSEEARDEYRRKAEELLIQIRDQQSKIRRFEESSRKRVEDQGRRMRLRLVDDIQEQVREYAKDKGYKAVIDVSGQSLNGVPLVIYYDPAAEITSDIIAFLNASATSEATP